jgi:nicotinate phosphoribosyltransferase
VLTVEGARPAAGEEPLLAPVMRDGRRLGPAPSLAEIRERVRAELAALPEPLRGLDPAPPYPVEVAPALRDLAAEADRLVARGAAVGGALDGDQRRGSRLC